MLLLPTQRIHLFLTFTHGVETKEMDLFGLSGRGYNFKSPSDLVGKGTGSSGKGTGWVTR